MGKPRMDSKGNNNNSNDSMEVENRNGLLCYSAARGCCFGVISLRTGVRLVAASLLLVSVLSLVETTVLIGDEDHEDDHETMLEVFGVITIMIGVCGCIQGCRAARSQEKRTAELFCWAIAFLLVLRVLQMVATAVWILANEHARQHLMGYICAELALVMCYVYGLYIALSYVKALWQDSTTMNGAVVA